MPAKANSAWLPKVLFESALITLSILLALALDEWREERQDQQTIEQAMSNFLREVRQNKARVDDANPFNKGLHDVLERRHQDGGIASVDEFVAIVESYSPVVLQSTAWETALATGALAKMDYNLVSALSLTYSLQNRYQQTSRKGLADFTSSQLLTPMSLDLAIFNSVRYLEDITLMESELGVVYQEVESVIRNSWIAMQNATIEEGLAWAETSANP